MEEDDTENGWDGETLVVFDKLGDDDEERLAMLSLIIADLVALLEKREEEETEVDIVGLGETVAVTLTLPDTVDEDDVSGDFDREGEAEDDRETSSETVVLAVVDIEEVPLSLVLDRGELELESVTTGLSLRRGDRELLPEKRVETDMEYVGTTLLRVTNGDDDKEVDPELVTLPGKPEKETIREREG